MPFIHGDPEHETPQPVRDIDTPESMIVGLRALMVIHMSGEPNRFAPVRAVAYIATVLVPGLR